jgi:hypothetical protein
LFALHFFGLPDVIVSHEHKLPFEIGVLANAGACVVSSSAPEQLGNLV